MSLTATAKVVLKMMFEYGNREMEYLKSRDKKLGAVIDHISLGMTFRKAEYIKDFSEKIINGSFDLDALKTMPDEAAFSLLQCGKLVFLGGVRWWDRGNEGLWIPKNRKK